MLWSVVPLPYARLRHPLCAAPKNMPLNFMWRLLTSGASHKQMWQPNMAAAPTEACQMTRKNGDLSARISETHTCLNNINKLCSS